MTKRGLSLKERFEQYYIPEPNSGCWLWMKFIDPDGYGIFSYWIPIKNKVKTVRANRFSYEIENGKIPDGMMVCHICDTPSCVNPDHLFLGSNSANQIDSALKGRAGRQKLSAEDVRNIRICIDQNVRTKELAIKFGVSIPTISNIKANRAWKHLK